MLRMTKPFVSSLSNTPLSLQPYIPSFRAWTTLASPSFNLGYPSNFLSSLHHNRMVAAATNVIAEGTSALSTLENLSFDNTFTTELPGDSSQENRVRQVQGAFFSYTNPSPTGTEPTTIASSPEVASLIGLDPAELDRPEFAMIFSGNAPLPASRPYAQCYGGHQFGSWAGQLGDGRAICLGEILNPRSGLRWELQLKGVGRTPYSRMADGRAVLRSSLREFVASEAMAALGVPTTRALSLVGTGDQVVRDMFYSGNPQLEPGAVVCRVARSFIRFGTFQLPVSRGEDQVQLAKQLADYVIRHFYPECDVKDIEDRRTWLDSNNNSEEQRGRGSGGTESSKSDSSANKYAQFLEAVAMRTAFLVSEWQRVGFTHGVLNTDNMSIVGDTIDYGPYGWIERFDPEFTPNTTDLPGRRYAFGAQPEVGQWNIVQLARALVAAGLVNEDEGAQGVAAYGRALMDAYYNAMARKMGMKTYDGKLAEDLLKEMFEDAVDYTNTFRALSSVEAAPTSGDDGEIPAVLAEVLSEVSNEDRVGAWTGWLRRYRAALRAEGWASEAERQAVQDSVNPAIIPRNHVLVDIIGEAEAGDYEPLHRYLKALETPYVKDRVDPAWCKPAPKKCRVGVELLSCSS